MFPERKSSWAWYEKDIAAFCTETAESAIGTLTTASPFPVTPAQVQAWQTQIGLLQRWLQGIPGDILLEFTIPRLGGRIDAVVLSDSAILAIEFKVGAAEFDYSAITQAWDYALDLKNFHSGSHFAAIIPIVVATQAPTQAIPIPQFAKDLVARPLLASCDVARDTIRQCVQLGSGSLIDTKIWSTASYKPTPTIVEAARALYSQHSVQDIARHDAGAQNLTLTSTRVEELIDRARSDRRKVICFVTGVPGAGKTLVGLNVATKRRDRVATSHAVYLSGNGPLVAVLREALVRDDCARRRLLGEKVSKGRLANPVKAFIQNVHHFRDAALKDSGPPSDHVVIFDEAQRAWSQQKTAQFMKSRKGQPDFQFSEPEFLMSYMDRHRDWAFVVCLVGGGQEIHTGEAGISEWLHACNARFPHWDVHISPNLTDSEYAAGIDMDNFGVQPNVHLDDALHLSVSMRSFRAEHVSHFVKALIDGSIADARSHLALVTERYPIVVTRSLEQARRWIRHRARGSERYGLVASSKAMRLKPHAIDIRASVDPIHWFLDGRDDIRSNVFLEDCATEFQVQGLELDWACVNWDADFRRDNGEWSHNDFRGSRWQRIRTKDAQNYLKNAYRVLLTRARQGMVLFVPPGDHADATRQPVFYDGTFDYLVNLGIPVLE
jgi:hypothetical protein